jgi:hypothetical protein
MKRAPVRHCTTTVIRPVNHDVLSDLGSLSNAYAKDRDAMETVVTGLSFAEGPAIDAESNLYIVEICCHLHRPWLAWH